LHFKRKFKLKSKSTSILHTEHHITWLSVALHTSPADITKP